MITRLFVPGKSPPASALEPWPHRYRAGYGQNGSVLYPARGKALFTTKRENHIPEQGLLTPTIILQENRGMKSQHVGIVAARCCSSLQRGAVGCFAAWIPRDVASFPRDSDCTLALRLLVMCLKTSPQRERHRQYNMALLTLYVSGGFGWEINSKCAEHTSNSDRSLLH